MFRKTIFAVLALFLAVFTVDRVAGFVDHGRFEGAVVLAQSSDDAGSTAGPFDAVCDGTFPDVSGDFVGNVSDGVFATGDAEIVINQNGGNVSGTWSASWTGPVNLTGTFTGKLSKKCRVGFARGMKWTMLIDGDKHCRFKAGADEPSPTFLEVFYKKSGTCKTMKNDGGIFNVFKQ